MGNKTKNNKTKNNRTKRKKGKKMRRYSRARRFRGGQREANIYNLTIYNAPRSKTPSVRFGQLTPDPDTLKFMLGNYKLEDDEIETAIINRKFSPDEIDHIFRLSNQNDTTGKIINKSMMFVSPKNDITKSIIDVNAKQSGV